MARRIIRQPNGLLCQWSTITDSVVSYNETIEDIVEERLADAKEKIARDIEHELEYSKLEYANQFIMKWEDLPVKTRRLILENKLA